MKSLSTPCFHYKTNVLYQSKQFKRPLVISNIHQLGKYVNEFDPFVTYGGGCGMACPSPGGWYHPNMTMIAPIPVMDGARNGRGFDHKGSCSSMRDSVDSARKDKTHVGYKYSSCNGMYRQGGKIQ